MTLRKLFLSHQHGDADALRELAIELRLRGVVPWVDKDGGFGVGDESVAEARRAIREDCFGLLLYATEKAFKSDFIREVELDEAIAVKREDPSFLLFAVPSDMGFRDLKARSVQEHNFDVSAFHGVPIFAATAAADRKKVATAILDKVLRRARAATKNAAMLSVQFSTREVLPNAADDVLRIDATGLLAAAPDDAAPWGRLLGALCAVKAHVAATYARPRLHVHGSKHLTAAFAFGRVFAPFEMDIRQMPLAEWRTDAPISSDTPFAVCVEDTRGDSGALFVEIASRDKDISIGVDTLLNTGLPPPAVRLQMRPLDGPLDVDNALCRAMVTQVYSEIGRVMQGRAISAIHLFAAVPQAFMMMLGREFKGMPPVQLYEWDGNQYYPSLLVTSGVL